MNRIVIGTAAAVLAALALLAFAAPFISPYPPSRQFRELFYKGPTPIRFRDQEGNWHLRPFIYAYERTDPAPRYGSTRQRLPLYFLVEGSPYRWMGLTWRTRLFGLRDTDRRIFLLGSDALGRDLFTRVLFGARFSLGVALCALLLTLLAGTATGALAGYAGGWVDVVLMRLVDLFLSLPGLFLVLAARAVFPVRLSAAGLFGVMVLVFALSGWAVVSRVIRGQVMSLKSRDYVLAARAMGASAPWILRRHILPFTGSYLLVQSTVLIPGFLLGEVTLSFLGVGLAEPHASWGRLLNDAASLSAIANSPWLLWPALLVFLTVAAFNLLGEEMKVRDRETRSLW